MAMIGMAWCFLYVGGTSMLTLTYSMSERFRAQAVNEFRGAVILVSHDRHMAEACADRFWLVGDGTVKDFDGDLDDYAKLLADRRRLDARGRRQRVGRGRVASHRVSREHRLAFAVPVDHPPQV